MSLPLPRSILVVGSGGREHAIVTACLKSPSHPRVLAAPGNGGIARDVKCFPVPVDDVPGLVALAKKERVDFVVVGPEVPLSLGLVDALIAAGIPAYGPKADGARLEASKIFTKELLLKHKIPTAPAQFFTEVAPALAYLKTRKAPYVIKADGLAAGKGVVVTPDLAEAQAAVRMMLEAGAFGASGKRILIEDCLIGEETSIHLVVSGREYVVLPTSQDHKRVGEGDTGPNTGGMGAYSPAEVVTDKMLAEIDRTICRPSVDAIAAEGIDFRGTLYIGIMLTKSGPQVLEFNTRFGDPETQVLLPRLATDPVALLWAAANNRLHKIKLEIKSDYALCVVLAAQGYPDKYPKGDAITLPRVTGTGEYIFHAGTSVTSNRQIVTNGGRVLGVTALAPTLRQAASRAYSLCDQIGYVSKYCRRDIGAKQLNRK
ncbi:MAG TPA: phosphoribosylamine--glycine ligase [Opitutaceae bacterium]|nr:phosphoribosylamine--glycine ligase [Opitutaceae bacterium]